MNDQKDQLENKVTFAAQIKQVVNNPAFQQALILRKSQLFEDFCNTKQDQEDVREEAWRTMKNIIALEDYFNELLTTGQMAETTLESMKDNNKD